MKEEKLRLEFLEKQKIRQNRQKLKDDELREITSESNHSNLEKIREEHLKLIYWR